MRNAAQLGAESPLRVGCRLQNDQEDGPSGGFFGMGFSTKSRQCTTNGRARLVAFAIVDESSGRAVSKCLAQEGDYLNAILTTNGGNRFTVLVVCSLGSN